MSQVLILRDWRRPLLSRHLIRTNQVMNAIQFIGYLRRMTTNDEKSDGRIKLACQPHAKWDAKDDELSHWATGCDLKR